MGKHTSVFSHLDANLNWDAVVATVGNLYPSICTKTSTAYLSQLTSHTSRIYTPGRENLADISSVSAGECLRHGWGKWTVRRHPRMQAMSVQSLTLRHEQRRRSWRQAVHLYFFTRHLSEGTQADRIVCEGDEALACGAAVSVALIQTFDSPPSAFYASQKVGLTVAHCGCVSRYGQP
jgi:hypothetical protein